MTFQEMICQDFCGITTCLSRSACLLLLLLLSFMVLIWPRSDGTYEAINHPPTFHLINNPVSFSFSSKYEEVLYIHNITK